jgi:four helix bundle protein
VRNYRDLKVWEKAHELTLQLYLVTKRFPKDELYGLTSQMRRCCISIEANLAEGCGRRSDPELARFLRIAMGSASELDCHLLLSKDLKYMSEGDYKKNHPNLSEVRRMLTSFLEAIESSARKQETSKTAAVAKS